MLHLLSEYSLDGLHDFVQRAELRLGTGEKVREESNDDAWDHHFKSCVSESVALITQRYF